MTTWTWENVDELYDLEDEDEMLDAFETLCNNSTPSDFYFHVGTDPDIGTIVSITPKAFFMARGYMFDQHIDLDHILPKDFSSEMEGVWSSSRTLDDVRKDLLSRGFEKNADFDDLFDGS